MLSTCVPLQHASFDADVICDVRHVSMNVSSVHAEADVYRIVRKSIRKCETNEIAHDYYYQLFIIR